MKHLMIAMLLALLLLLALPIGAQDDTGTTAPTAADSTIQFFFVACEDAAVVNLSGNMRAGFDAYYQVFAGAVGGTPLTGLRRVAVNGEYAVSDRVAYNSGSTLGAGASASIRVLIAPEGRPELPVYEDSASDVQDGCAEPQNALIGSDEAGTNGGGTTTTSAGGSIRSPFGGFINPQQPTTTPEPLVVIGARRTDQDAQRSATPGVIFAECNQYLPQADPGLLYNNDNIVLFWSWFSRTEQQAFDHIFNAQYAVRLNRAPLSEVMVSQPERIDGMWWTFYTVNIGRLTPGTYGVEFRLTWENVISDGFEDFGPGTANEVTDSNCSFTIKLNPDNIPVTNYNWMYSLR